MTPATVVESPTRIRELPRSTIREQAAKLRNPGRPIEVRPARVQALELERRIVADRQALQELQTVVASQAPRRWIVADSRVPSVVRTEEVLPRWTVTAGKQAVKACPPHNPHKKVAEVEVPAAVAEVEVPAAVVAAVVAVAAAVVEDKEGRI
jgi:hypothetical protein